MKNLIKDYKKDLGLFKEITDKFYNKEVSIKDYKSFSGSYGSYAQRGANRSMLRLPFCGGHVTKKQLKFITNSIKKYNINNLHFTTGQSIQLHDLTGQTVCEIMEEAFDYDIITRGSGGDNPQNIKASPLTGVDSEEYFDVYPYAKATADYVIGFIKTIKLPRKFKVSFTSSGKNDVYATFRDLGFAATPYGTFDVYTAGGLGPNPLMGVRVAQHVEPSKVLYHVKAMLKTFTTYGNYKNRHKARSRFIQLELGREEYVKAYLTELAKVEAVEQLDIQPKPITITKTGLVREMNHPRITAQKQNGLYYVTYHPIGGTPAVADFVKLYAAMENIEETELRIGPDKTAYIINLTADEAEKIAAVTESSAATTLLETSVSCVGKTICQVGLQDSQELLETIIASIKPYRFKDGILPRLHISGCPSSCGTSQIGAIGFHGSVKLVDRKPQSAFQVFVNGSKDRESERFGTLLGTMAAADIPEFLIALGKMIMESGETFATWYPNHETDFKLLAAQYI